MRIAPWLLASGIASVAVAAAFSCSTPTTGPTETVTFAASSVAATSGAGGTTAAGGSGGKGGTGQGGKGGAATVGMGGSGGGSGGGTTGMGGQGGAGGAMPPPDQKVNGCQLKDAIDLTSAGPAVNMTYSGGTNGVFSVALGAQTVPLKFPMCLKIKFNQVVHACQNPPSCSADAPQGSPLIVGGEVDPDTGVGSYDIQSPIQPNCFKQGSASFNPNNVPACYRGGTWPCGKVLAVCNNATQNAFQIQAYPFYNNSKKEQQFGVLYVLQ